MIKTNDIENVQYKLSFSNFENVLNVYEGEDGQYFYNLLRTVNIPEDLSEEFYDLYSIKFGDIWPNIAYNFYNDVNLWWVLCSTNQIQDPTITPKPGTTIKIIKREYIPDILGRLS